jgi:hypothetical protein
MEDHDVCWGESQTWFQCIEGNLLNPKLMQVCTAQRESFDKCVGQWRAVVGPCVKLKGANQGEPPLQCAGISCLIAQCTVKVNWDFDKCTQVTKSFKHCVKGLYGKEFVDE